MDEHTIRLSYGPSLAMEFLLLANNQIAVRDCSVGFSRKTHGGPSLGVFWRAWRDRTEGVAGEIVEQSFTEQHAQQQQPHEMATN